MLKGFRDFILRGNVIELAVAVVMGTAFTAIVTSFSEHLISPLIAAVGGNPDVGLGIHIIAGNDATYLDFGAVISSAINFLIIASIVYFVLILPMNKINELQEKRKKVTDADSAEEPAEVAPIEVQLLAEIRDLLKTQQS
ncbi:large conductance mechanosensitive channel protein MscL [Corynebacterium caspium]|uniref:large conductance mechanosensitive channel protein MscL n=1 Tax=Corynebacterium caspium TaxID=234828 RepID=UPI000476B646|nr:large conductance mechanosensitive channel protein MscL [Corynebacterium caspium]